MKTRKSTTAAGPDDYPRCNATTRGGVPIYWTPRDWTYDCSLYPTSGRRSARDQAAVKALQRSLRWCNGGSRVTIDGWFGPQTEAALKRVQRRVGATVDGWYGPETRKKMSHFLKRGRRRST
ncbi:MAG: peptidoglycan-binding domain-containing protein [Propioniciclava sp.]